MIRLFSFCLSSVLSFIFTGILAFFCTVNVFAQPSNDACSGATTLVQNGTCVSSTTVAANDSWTGIVGCQSGNNHEDVWFTFVATGTLASFTVTNGTMVGDIELIIASATSACTGLVDAGSQCGPSPLNASVSVTSGTTYYLTISSASSSEGTFTICETTSTPPAGCTDNDNCLTPATVTYITGVDTCLTDCNTGAAQGPNFAGNNCYDFPDETVWYSVITTASSATMAITLTSTDLTAPYFSIFTTSNCTNFTIVNCTQGSAGSATNTIGVMGSTTYLIAISDDLGAAGNFTLCVKVNDDNSVCNKNNSLTVTATSMGSPLAGPYQAGELVSFCYTITNFTQSNCNYLQGIVPSFGSCWDPVSFDAQGKPVTITTPLATAGVIQPCPPGPPCAWAACVGTPAGAWSWFPASSVTYNNINNPSIPNGTALGAGWFFLTSYSSTTGSCTGDPTDPDNSFGDSNFPSCTDSSLDWTVCFQLQARTNGVTACINGQTDCSVTIKTYADGEIGVWDQIACMADISSASPSTTLACCAPTPIAYNVSGGSAICTGAPGVTVTLSGSETGVTYHLYINGVATGDSVSGTGATLSFGNQTAAGTYTVIGIITATGCGGQMTGSAIITVPGTVPTVSIAPASATNCNGGSVALTATVTPNPATLPVTFTNSTVTTIPNNDPTGINSTITVSGVTPTTLSAGVIASVCFTITHAKHQDIGNSQAVADAVQITGPGGTAFNFTPLPTTGAGTITYCFPVATLNSITGITNGTWTLHVEDNKNPNTGTLDSWSIVFNTTNSSTFSWSPTTDMTGSGTLTPTVNPATTTSYIISATDAVGCSNSDTITVTVNASPTAAISPNPANACAGVGLALNSNPSGGSGTYTTHTWTGAGAASLSSTTVVNPTFTNSTAGTYALTYTVTDNNGCSGTSSITITVNANPTASISPNPAATCAGVALSMNGNPAGGTAPYTHAWTGAGSGSLSSTSTATPSFTNSTAGSYSLTYTVTDNKGCVAASTLSVTVNANPTAAISPNPAATCAGMALSMNGNPAGGTAPYTHAWTGAGSGSLSSTITATPTFTNGTAGSYSLTYTVTDNKGCVASSTLIVTVNANPAAAISPNPANACAGVGLAMNGNPSGGSGTYTTHAWSGAGAASLSSASVVNPTFTNAAAGTYALTYTVTDNKGCIGSSSLSVTVNANPTAAISPNPAVTCSGVALSMNGNPAGGTVPYTHTWTGAGSGSLSSTSIVAPVFTNGTAGSYSLTYTVTDSKGCTGASNLSVTVNAIPANPTAPGATICSGASVTLTATAPGGTYQWYDSTSGGSLLNTGASYTTPSLSSNTTYYVQTTLSGCTSTGRTAVTVTINPALTVSGLTATCLSGDTTYTVSFTINGGNPATYSVSGSGTLTGSSFTSNPIPTGTPYSFTATDTFNCTPQTVSGNKVCNCAATAVISGGGTICAGDSATVSVALTGTGPWNFTYTDGTTPVTISGQVTSPYTFKSSVSAIYTITAVNDVVCTGSGSGSATVIVKPLPTAAVSGGGAVCTGNTATVSVSLTGTGPWSITYAINGTNQPVVNGIISSPYTITTGTAGTYTIVAVSDANCPGTFSGSAVVVINSKPIASITPDPASICASVNLPLNGNPAGGSGVYSTHLWSGSGAASLSTTNIAAPVFNNSSVGSFTLIYSVTDNNGCSGSDTILVTVNTNPTSAISPDPSEVCAGINLLMSGNPTGGSGTYSTHSWTGAGAASLSATNTAATTFNNSTSGTYTLIYTVTDNNGCSSFDTIAVTVNGKPVPAITPDPATVCSGSALLLNGNPAGGSGSYPAHSWTGSGAASLSATNIAAPVFNNSSVGSYFLTYLVTDNKGCSGSDTITVTVNANPVTSITPDPAVVCAGNSLSMNGSPAGGSGTYSTHLWSGVGAGSLSSTNTPAVTFNNIIAGSYALTYAVTDNLGCSGSDSITVTVNVNPTASVIPDPAVVCENTNISLNGNPVGGSGAYLTHAWTGAGAASLLVTNTATPTFNNNTSGAYELTYTVTDNKGCAGSDTITVTVNDNPLPAIIPDPATVCAGLNLALNGNPSGGSGTYTTHAWTGAGAGSLSAINTSVPIFNNIAPGSYALMYSVTDNLGCSGSDTITVTVKAKPTINITPSPATTCAGVGLSMNGNPAGGSGVYSTHLWSGAGAAFLSTTNTAATIFNSSSAGSYPLTYFAMDTNGCSASDTVSVTVIVKFIPEATISGGGSVCSGTNATVSIALTGTGPWNFTYTDGTTPVTITGQAVSPYFFNTQTGGTYTVTAVSDSNCTGTSFGGSALVIVNSNPASSIIPDPASVCSGINLPMNGNPSGGSGIYTTHAWTGAGAVSLSDTTVVNPVFNSTTNGLYTLNYTVTDSNGCKGADTITITVFQNPVAAIIPDPVNACAGKSIPFNGNPTGGSGAYSSHLWTGAGSASLSDTIVVNPVFNNAASGTYTLNYTVTDSSGCLGTDTIIVTVNALPTANITPDPATVCAGGNLALKGNPSGGSGFYLHLWTGTGATSLDFTNKDTALFINTIVGSYSLTYTITDSLGCTNSDTINVTVNALPVVSLALPLSVCINQNPFPLTGGLPNPPPGTGIYSGNFVSGGSFNPTAAGAGSQTAITYTYTDTNNCKNSDTKTISVSPQFGAAISNPGKFCTDDDTVLLSAASPGGVWSVVSGSASALTGNIFNPSAGDGLYMVKYVIAGACGGSDSVSIVVNKSPVANAGNDVTLINGLSTTLSGSASTTAGNYLWSPSSGLSCVTCPTTKASPVINTTYVLKYTDINGCSDTDAVEITIDQKYLVYVPNMFSPNGDHENDVLYVRGSGIKSFKLNIYDRWGERVFETEETNNGWDGTYNGKAMNSAVFVYILNVEFINGEKPEPLKGNVTLVR